MGRKLLCMVLTVLLVCLCAGCGPQDKTAASGRQVTDALGRTVTVPAAPQRVVALSTSLVDLTAAVQGDLMGRSSVRAADASVPKGYEDVPEMGPVYSVNMEKVLAVQPDLVLVSATQQSKLVPVLEQNGIAVLALKTKTYDEVRHTLDLLGTVYGHQAEARDALQSMEQRLTQIKGALPAEKPRIAILHATAKSVTLELPHSIAGSTADILGLPNIAAEVTEQTGADMETVPLSLEFLTAQNPDILFVTSMGKADQIEARLQEDLAANPAWSSLKAVQTGRVYILPGNLFLLSPGVHYPDAAAYMAEKAFPGLSL